MTLRLRLLFVYLIVVLLSVATVGVALFELDRSRLLIRQVQDWNKIKLNFQKLDSAWPRTPSADPDAQELRAFVIEQFRYLAREPVYLDVEPVRNALGEVYRRYNDWENATAPERTNLYEGVRSSLADLGQALEMELDEINLDADNQEIRTRVLLAVVIALTALHVLVIGSLLRRWLLWPMERLGRQVEALAHDQPPAEPLLSQPLEMASLAQALDRARRCLGEYRQQLIEAERLTTIGQFAAQLAHNLRNPLASIRAAAQVAARHQRDDPYLQQRMDEIIASVDRLNRWVAGLTEVARREPRAQCSADVVPVLQRVCETVAPELAAKELVFDLDVPEGGIACWHDPDTLEHALIAMVINAIEASPVGGRIDFVARRARNENDDAAVCRISVVDRGPGLPAGDPDRVFEFSFSTKQRGMGLGLALARQALQRQGGSAHAHSNPDQGATVYVDLPIEPGTEKFER